MKIKAKLILITLLTLSTSCSTIPADITYAAPVRPRLSWQDDGDRASISKEDAVKLAHYFIEVDAYITKTGGR